MILAVTSDVPLWQILLSVFGGLGIFLFGINMMSDSLKVLAGNKLKLIIEKTTNTPLKGIVVGAGVTALIQSSSGTTALTVGLVRAGLMSFPQAVGVIMGANIGTTVTSFLIGLNISEYSMLFVGLGAVMIFFFKKKKIIELGHVLLGFGLLFFGLDLMGTGLKQILEIYNEQATALFSALSNHPILGLFVGTILTAVIQSSSAAIGILQSLYGTGQISIAGALPILLGSNIGTTVTALLASIGGSVPAKRTAVVHTLFNILGALLFMIILNWVYVPVVAFMEEKWLMPSLGAHPTMTIAIAHMVFNVVSTFILFFFIKQMCFIAKKIVPGSESTSSIADSLLDFSLIEKSPILALEFVKKCIDYMGQLTMEYFALAKDYSFAKANGVIEKANEYERNINSLDKKIHDYLIKLTLVDLEKNESNILSKYLDTIKDLERIGDHCSNIVEFFEERYQESQVLSEEGAADLTEMYETLEQMVTNSIKSISVWDKEQAKAVPLLEEKIDKMEEKFRKKHVLRINSGVCSYSNADHYVDVLSNLERIGDHSNNIAANVINDEYCQFDEFNH